VRTRVLQLGLVLAAVIAALGTAAAGAGGGRTLVVDDDRAQCRNAAYTTIQAAVAAASPGDVIRVCPGTYGATTVDKTLRIDGSTSVREGKRCLDRASGEDPTRDSIVNGGAGAPAFRIGANDVEIRDFTVQNTTNDAGISVPSSFSGTRVHRNLIQENTFGVYLNSSGARASKVERNCFRDNNKPGSAAGNGVYSDQGLRRAHVERNTFTGHTNAAVILVGPLGSQTAVEIERNALRDDAPIILAKVSRSTVAHNLSVKSKGSGIFFGGNVTDVRVKSNTIRECAFSGIHLRTDPATFATTAPNTGNVVENNVVAGCREFGIRLRDGANRNLVRNNRVQGNGTGTPGDGISLENADENVVRGNKSDDNRRDGLRADSASTGNRIEKNRLAGNREHDCHDDSTGTGTAGTANTWKQNQGATENRVGLCHKGRNAQRADDRDDDAKDKKRKKHRKAKKHKQKNKDRDHGEDDD
jgi:parallel beta-helix repeat protein